MSRSWGVFYLPSSLLYDPGMDTILTAGAVQEVTGLSYRQLDHFARTGVCAPSVAGASGKGTRRLYDRRDLFRLRLVAALRKLGMRLEEVRRVIGALDGVELPDDEDLNNVALAIDGDSVCLVDRQELPKSMRRGDAPFYLLPLTGV